MSSSSFTGDTVNILPTNYIIPSDPEEKDLKLRQYLNNIAEATNSKDSGIYNAIESVTGGQFVPTYSTNTPSNATYRSILRKVIDFGTLPNTTTKSVAHGITNTQNFSFVRIYATATDPGVSTINSSIPIPYASSTAADNIELEVDATNINITTGIDRTAYTRCFVVLEWIQTI